MHPSYDNKVLNSSLLCPAIPITEISAVCGPPYEKYDGVAFDLVGTKEVLEEVLAAFDIGDTMKNVSALG